MPAPPNLPAALFHHAVSHPEEPWLFRAEGWDWRWHSWGKVAREVMARAEGLSGCAAGSRYAFPYTARPEDVILDSAVQAAGLVSVPTSSPPPPSPPRPSSPAPSLPTTPGEEGEKQEESAFKAPSPGEGERKDQKDSKDEQGRKSAFFPSPGGREGAGEGPGVRARAGGAVVVHEGEPIELSAAELIATAERIQDQIGPTKGRDIVVLSGSLEIPEERAMLSWATLAGAAVVLEPNPALRVATAAWVRPTVFHGTVAELAALRNWVEKEKRGWLRSRPRLPFRRLRAVLLTGSETLRVEEEAFWAERGVGVARI
jgi:hypothetical protein